jgi:hypothetical protein
VLLDWDETGDIPYFPIEDLSRAELVVLWALWENQACWVAHKTHRPGTDSEWYEYVIEILGAFWYVHVNENMAPDVEGPFETADPALELFAAAPIT